MWGHVYHAREEGGSGLKSRARPPIWMAMTPVAVRPAAAYRPRVLCVDDEPNLLDALKLVLKRHYDVRTACDGTTALELLRADGPFLVVLSDMRMPGMDGAQFLRRARAVAPAATRMLLTGHAGMDDAIAAV